MEAELNKFLYSQTRWNMRVLKCNFTTILTQQSTVWLKCIIPHITTLTHTAYFTKIYKGMLSLTHRKTRTQVNNKGFLHIQHKFNKMTTQKILLALHICTQTQAFQHTVFNQKQYNIHSTVITRYLTPQTTAALCAHLHNNLNCIYMHFL